MTLNSNNPQRGTGVRKAATGVNPAVPASARPATSRVPAVAPGARPATARVPAVSAAPAAEAPAAPAGRSTGVRKPGAPVGGAARPALRSASAPKQGSKGMKYLMLTIIILLVAMVAYCFIPLGGKAPLAIRMARMWGLMKKPGAEPAEEVGSAGAASLETRYKAALAVRERAAAFLADQEQKYKDAPQTLTEVDVHRVLGELEILRNDVYRGVDDIAKGAEGKDPAINADSAKEELKKQKTAAMDLGKAILKWKGPKDQIFSSGSDFVARKFDPTPAPAPDKPAEKKDPKSMLTVVAPATPNDIPKPTEPPKEDPKPAEPKPEPEKPKPAEPKPEPEKPKVEPKPEPEKPKPAEPKPEPEKPKPAEPKPEPEKPKEEPKPAEPKPEPEKPKPAEPKPEPEKPKEEPKPAEPKPEPKVEKKVDVIVAEADKLVLEGSPLAKDVIVAARNLPSDPEKLKTLSMKAETAQAFFVKAKDSYVGVKDTAPDPAYIGAQLTKIDKILALLQSAADAINSKRK